jgi:hypothetical protein
VGLIDPQKLSSATYVQLEDVFLRVYREHLNNNRFPSIGNDGENLDDSDSRIDAVIRTFALLVGLKIPGRNFGAVPKGDSDAIYFQNPISQGPIFSVEGSFCAKVEIDPQQCGLKPAISELCNIEEDEDGYVCLQNLGQGFVVLKVAGEVFFASFNDKVVDKIMELGLDIPRSQHPEKNVEDFLSFIEKNHSVTISDMRHIPPRT